MLLLLSVLLAAEPTIEMAVTVDDLPRHGPEMKGKTPLVVAKTLLEVFKRHGVPQAYGFVNGGRGDRAVLEAWVKAGQPLANHVWSHPDLETTAAKDYIAEIDRSVPFLDALWPNPKPRYFRYPYLHEGDDEAKRTAIREHLEKTGHTIAHVTIDPFDWAYNEAYVRCLSAKKAREAKALREQYLTEARAKLRWSDTVSQQVAGRRIRHVLLLHLGVIDADAIDELLTQYEKAGAKWITLEDAFADPIYAVPSTRITGGHWLYQLFETKGLRIPPAPTTPFELIDAICR